MVAGESQSQIARKLADNYLSMSSPNVFLDYQNSYKSYVGTDFLQGRVLLFSDGEFSGEIIADPSELGTIPIVIDAFFTEQNE